MSILQKLTTKAPPKRLPDGNQNFQNKSIDRRNGPELSFGEAVPAMMMIIAWDFWASVLCVFAARWSS
jgi:hypothetical protein